MGVHKYTLLPILSVNFVGTLGFSIVLPFLVYLVTRWGGNALVFGLIGATYSAFQLIGAPILGRWSDRYGRRRILLLSQAGTLVSWTIFLAAFFLPVGVIHEVRSSTLGHFAITLPLIVLFVARAVDGITGGNVSVANAYLADITDDDDRSRNFGRMAIAGNLGFVLGPALAGILAATVYEEILPVVAALLISVVATLIIAFCLEDVDPCELEHDPEPRGVRRVFGQDHKECYRLEDKADTPFREVLGLPGIPALLAVYFLVMAGFSLFYTAFPIHAVRGLDWSIAETGTFFAAMSLMMVVAQGPVLVQASRLLPDRILVIAGSLVLGAGFALLTGGSTVLLYGAAACIALGNGLMWPSAMAILSRLAGHRYQGAVQGFAGSAGAFASIVGLILGGLLYDWAGIAVFVVAAVVISLVAAIAATVRVE